MSPEVIILYIEKSGAVVVSFFSCVYPGLKRATDVSENSKGLIEPNRISSLV
jgi:hypothetical protein